MLVTLEKAIEMINEGRTLHIAADESLLQQLPTGNWIGGTTPYFIAEEGGQLTKDKLFVNEFDFAEEVKVAVYGKYNIFQIVEECYDNGLTMIILPYGSKVTEKYAKEAPDVEELLLHPTVGWVAGCDLDDFKDPKTFDGTTGDSYTDKAVVMYFKLPEGKTAMINLVNIFEDDKNDPIITFPDNALDVSSCYVDGEEHNFAEYIKEQNIDTKMPLVADYNGVYLNISIKAMEDDRVILYAPVFKGIEYRFAKQVSNYVEEFNKRSGESGAEKPIFSCNCILNYLYGGLEGKKTEPYYGPVTFGEIAYQLINQTLAYCEIV